MLKALFFMITLLHVFPSYALQLKKVQDNSTVSATVSSNDITRITVKDDRIKRLRGNKGAYLHENDEEKGEVFLQPSQSKAFTVLLETEKGKHFTLLLNPLNVPGDTLMLISQGESENKMPEKNDIEMSVLFHLVKAMHQGIVPEGYQLHKTSKAYPLKNLKARLLSVYSNDILQGEVFEIENNSNVNVTLLEQDFYKPKTRIISIASRVLHPWQKTTLYRVVQDEQ